MAKNLESLKFLKVVEDKEDVYHDEGYCLKFVRVENLVNLKTHSIAHFRDAEIAKLEEEANDKAVKVA